MCCETQTLRFKHTLEITNKNHVLHSRAMHVYAWVLPVCPAELVVKNHEYSLFKWYWLIASDWEISLTLSFKLRPCCVNMALYFMRVIAVTGTSLADNPHQLHNLSHSWLICTNQGVDGRIYHLPLGRIHASLYLLKEINYVRNKMHTQL